LSDLKTIKYLISNSEEEIRRFQNVAHKYLCKRLITNYYKIKKGFNRIMLETNKLCTSHFILNTQSNIADKLNIKFNAYFPSSMNIPYNENNENNDAEIEINIRDKLNDGKILKYTCTLHEIQHDSEFNCKNDYNDTYVFDAFNNIQNTDNHQPNGHMELTNESNLVIQSEIDQEIDIEITFCTYDVLRIFNNQVIFATQYQEPIPEPVVNPIPDPVVNPIINPIVNPIIDKQDKFQYYEHIILNFIQMYERMIAERRYLDDDENCCLISLDEIKYGEYYYACDQCKKPFGYESFKQMFIRENYTRKCPHCRITLNHYPKLYINKNPITIINKNNVIWLIQKIMMI
jgi:hypothetical protein